MGIRFETRPLVGLGPNANALLILPEGQLRVGRERLTTEGTPGPSAVDDAIIRAATKDAQAVRVTVFCGRSRGNEGSWGFAEDLTYSEVQALARNLVRSQLPVYRRLFAAGVSMHIRIDFGGREQSAFRDAHAQLEREFKERAAEREGVQRELAEMDAWLLRDFVFFFSVDVERLINKTLGEHASAMAQRQRHAQRKRDALSEAALRTLAKG